jgi:hypothetical protein
MAEIKSTLELVMERTRHLYMTEEDKRKQAAEALNDAVKRLVGKCLDGRINPDRFAAELDQLGGGAPCRKVAAAEIGRRIDPVADNTVLLDLIRNGLGFDIAGIEAILHDFGEAARSEEHRVAERIKAALLKKGIFGNAVIPNLEVDKDWAGRHKELTQAVRVELDEQIAKLEQSP